MSLHYKIIIYCYYTSIYFIQKCIIFRKILMRYNYKKALSEIIMQEFISK